MIPSLVHGYLFQPGWTLSREPMLPLMSSLTSHPETISIGYINQANGTIRGREVAHSRSMKQSNLWYIQRIAVHIKTKFLFSETTFLSGLLPTNPNKVLPMAETGRAQT